MNSLFKTYLKFSGCDIDRVFIVLKQIQSLSPGEFRKWQDEKKRKIVKHHYDNNQNYRNKVGNHFPNIWEELPIMKKSDFQNDLNKLMSKGYTKRNTFVANTSGSSGHPFFFAKSAYAYTFNWAIDSHRYEMHNLKLTSKQARFFGIPSDNIRPFYIEKIKDIILNRIRFNIFDLSDHSLSVFYDLFYKYKFEYIYGYSNSIYAFARYIIEHNKLPLKDICTTLKVCIPTAEMCTIEDEAILHQAFKVPIIQEYGASECGTIAIHNKENYFILSSENLFVEIVDDNNKKLSNGTPGKILITDLYNKAMPFIRYEIGDIGAINSIENFPYKILSQLVGRTNDMIVLPSGKKSPGLTFYYISRSILEASGVLKEFIIRQTSINEFVFDVVTNRQINEHEKKLIEEKMDYYLEPGLTLKINRVRCINRQASGKIQHFFSEISN